MGDPFKILFSREQEPKRIESRENELDSIESRLRPARAREERRIGLVGGYREIREERAWAEKCGNSDSGASVFHKGPRVRSLNGPPRAHCAHCQGSCLGRKHASRPESAKERMNDRRNRAGYKRTLDNHVTMKRGLFLDSSPGPWLENVSPLLHLGGNSCRGTTRDTEVDGKTRADQWTSRGLLGFIADSLQKWSVRRPLKNGKWPLSAKGFPVVVARIR